LIPLLPRGRACRNSGYSVVMWAAMFAVMVGMVLFFRTPIKRAMQGKINDMADYMFWTKWGQAREQYKGDDTGYTKTDTTTISRTELADRRGFVTSAMDISVGDSTSTTGVNDGDQDALKSIDLNAI